MPPCSACEHWSAPYDGTDPSPEQHRSDTPGNDTDEEDDVIVQQVRGDCSGYLTISPPPTAPSPSLSSSDTVSTGNQTGRASSVLELEWDDIFADHDPSSAVLNKAPRRTPTPPPLPPRYIQEMRRTATKLVHGSYVEESEFQDDVLVYDLVAQKDTKAAILERIMAANRQARAGLSHRVSSITAGMMITETGSSVTSSKRRSEVGGEEEGKWGARGEQCGKEAEDGIRMADIRGKLHGHQLFFGGFSGKGISECDETDEDGAPVKPQCNRSDQQSARLRTQPPPPCFPNGHPEPESPDFMASPSRPGSDISGGDGFLSRYCELMRSLGVEPDCDDITDDVGTFRKRIRALKQKVDEDEDAETIEALLSSLRAEGEDAMMDEVEGEEEGEERSISEGVRRVPFTGLSLKQNFDTGFLAAC